MICFCQSYNFLAELPPELLGLADGVDDTVPQNDGLLRTPLKEPDPEQGESEEEDEAEEEASCVSVGRQIAQFSVSLLFANSSQAHAIFGTKPKEAQIGTINEIKR